MKMSAKKGPFDRDPFQDADYKFIRGYFQIYNANPDSIIVRELMHTISRNYDEKSCDVHDNGYYEFNISANGTSELYDFDYRIGENAGKDKWSITVTYQKQDYDVESFPCDLAEDDEPLVNMTINMREMMFSINLSDSGMCRADFELHEKDEFDQFLEGISY